MSSFHRNLPPAIKEIVESSEFYKDEDLQDKILDSKMTRQYVIVMFVCCCLLGLVVLI